MSHWGSLKNSALNIQKNISTKDEYKCISRLNIINYNGPLNENILSIIYGSLLGDGHLEKRKGGKGTRMCFYQEGSHKEYLLYLHSLISSLGYCNTNTPKISKRLGNKGKIREIIRFSTWTYRSLNKIKNEWYTIEGKKRVPESIEKVFTPLLLAIWIMDDGSKIQKSLKLCTNDLVLNDIEYLGKLLYKKYNIETSIHKTGVENQYNFYIKTNSMDKLRKIVLPYIVPSMKYKISI